MKKMKQKVKEIFLDKKLYIFSIVTFLFFGVYCRMQYAPDTYSVFANTLKETVLTFFSSGRIVTGVFFYGLMGVLKLNPSYVYSISYIVAIVCTIISLYRLDKLFHKDIKNELISSLAAILIIINVFSIELFVYIEKGILMLSVLLCVLAVEQINKFLEGNRKSIIGAFLFMLIANCCYQGTVGLFVAISLIYIIKYAKNIKAFIMNNVIVALVYGVPAVINFMMVRFVFSNARVKGEIILVESLQKIMTGTKNMFLGTYDLFPPYLWLAIIVVLMFFIIYKIIKKQENTKSKILEILGMGYVLLGTIVITVAPQILQDTNSIWFVARSSYSVGALIGILILYAATKIKIKKIERKVILSIGVIILAIQFSYFTRFTIDNYIVNYQDRQNVQQIEEAINQYEKETGNLITKVAFYEDKNPNYTYPTIKTSRDMNLKALYPDWSKIAIIQYYTGRRLEQTQKDEELATKFKEKDWNYYSNEQIILEKDTMHLCNF